jgi:amino acid permease
MAKPASFPVIMWGVHLFVATVVSAFGLVGYLAFYNCTQGPIIGNLPSSEPLTLAVIWSLNVCLHFTYPIQMVPVFQILEDFFLLPSLEATPAECCGRRARVLEVIGFPHHFFVFVENFAKKIVSS